jgi:hypothetical protein
LGIDRITARSTLGQDQVVDRRDHNMGRGYTCQVGFARCETQKDKVGLRVGTVVEPAPGEYCLKPMGR